MLLPPHTNEAHGASDFCARLLSKIACNGFHPFPIRPGTKKTDWKNWPVWCRHPPQADQIARWRERHGHYGLAIATDYACIAIESDEEDPHRSTSECEA